MLANDRRIAENTARIPHPYRAADAEDFIATANLGNEAVFMITLSNGAKNGLLIGACGFTQVDRHPPEIGYWLGVKHWGKGYATEAVRAMIDHAFVDLDCDAIHSSARVTNPASRRVLEKCGFQWTGAGLLRIRAIASSAPIDRFRLDRGLWASLKSWGASTSKRVA
jgi:RimJ/RimL family protein N-acetyltransferase